MMMAINPLNVKDSSWLQLEVCREFQRNKCTRSDTECKFAHPASHIEVQNGRVVACYDSIKGRCNREKPPCKYFHPPQHLKDSLLIQGKNHLALKNALLNQMPLQTVLSSQLSMAQAFGPPPSVLNVLSTRMPASMMNQMAVSQAQSQQHHQQQQKHHQQRVGAQIAAVSVNGTPISATVHPAHMTNAAAAAALHLPVHPHLPLTLNHALSNVHAAKVGNGPYLGATVGTHTAASAYGT